MKAITKTKINLYLILDLMPGASHSEILHAYNRAKRTYSEGSLAGYSLIDEEAKAPILVEIEEAFGVLGNPVKRREYDIQMGFETWRAQDEEELSAHIDTKSFVSKPSIRTLEDGFLLPEDMEDVPPLTHQQAPKRVVEEVEKKPLFKSEKKVEKVETKPSAMPADHKADILPLPTAINPNFEANPQFEAEIRSAEDVDGAFLKAVRIYRRLSLEQLAQRCKLQPVHAIAIEEEDQSRIPHQVYLRGHVLMICQVLDLPHAEQIAKNYVARMKKLGKLPKAIF